MTVASGAIGADGKIGARYSAYGANLSPALEWSPVAGARSYAVILEDPDAPAPRPWSHWLIWNIAPAETSLPEGVRLGARRTARPARPRGRGDAGDIGYFGPKPPGGTHHYHFRSVRPGPGLGPGRRRGPRRAAGRHARPRPWPGAS